MCQVGTIPQLSKEVILILKSSVMSHNLKCDYHHESSSESRLHALLRKSPKHEIKLVTARAPKKEYHSYQVRDSPLYQSLSVTHLSLQKLSSRRPTWIIAMTLHIPKSMYKMLEASYSLRRKRVMLRVKFSRQHFVDLLRYGITILSRALSLTFMISVLSSSIVSTLVFQLKHSSPSPNEKINTKSYLQKDLTRKC